MSTFAEIVLHPGGVIAWLAVGLVAGWLAGRVLRGRGYGTAVDLLAGLIGAAVGGLSIGLLVAGDVGFWGSIVVAFVGACVLIAVVRFVARERTPL